MSEVNETGPLTGRVILRRAVSVFRDNPGATTLHVAVALAPTLLYTFLFEPAVALLAQAGADARLVRDVAGPVGALIYALGLVVGYAALTHGTVRVLDGHPPSLVEALGRAARRLPVLALVLLPTSLAAGLGLALVAVPGVYLMALLFPLVAVVVEEVDLGPIESVARASALTQGSRGPLAEVTLALAAVVVGECCLCLCGIAYPTITTAPGESILETDAGFVIGRLMHFTLTTVFVTAASLCTGAAYVELRAQHPTPPKPTQF